MENIDPFYHEGNNCVICVRKERDILISLIDTLREAAIAAAEEWSAYVLEDNAPVVCALFVAKAIDAELAKVQGPKV